ncbi:MAG: DUF975 family protein [Oscillospiraceae bacterium]|nr:DUF975 family protein [Oscillospiraceae bacterium]
MDITRAELKQAAKKSMRGVIPHPMLVTLVYNLIPLAAFALVALITSGTAGFLNLYHSLDSGDLAQLEAAMDTMITGPAFLVYFLQLLLSLAGLVLNTGFTWYCLDLARRRPGSFLSLFDAFYDAGRVILTGILTYIFIFLWSLLFIIPGIIAAYRYRMAFFILLDYPEVSALEAIAMSKEMMRGHKMDLFLLDLSFIGWLLLVPFTCGILGLWVAPYSLASAGNFYAALNRRFTGGGPFQEPL